MATSSSISVASFTTASGLARTRRSPISVASGKRWSTRCARSGLRSSAGRAAVSPTVTIGATASVRASRPRRNNFWATSGRLRDLPDSSPAKNDPNWFGTNEFLRFSKLIDAEPYLAANLRGMTAKDFNEWVEYCNSPAGASTPAERRAANGDRKPFNVRYWGVGNESWGCGGEMTSEEYSVEVRKFTAWTPRFGTPLSFIASGPNGGDYKWSRGFFGRLAEKNPGLINRVWGWALHYYCGRTGKGENYVFLQQKDKNNS